MADINYWIENTTEENHYTKCLWCPNHSNGKSAGWLDPVEEMEEGDKVIHHLNKEDKGFTGESKIKEIRTDINKDELEEGLKEIDGWDDSIRNNNPHYQKYDDFNLVITEGYKEFDKYVDYKTVKDDIGNPPNIDKKLFNINGYIGQWYLRKINEDVYDRLKYLTSGDITPTTVDELEFGKLFQSKKQVILYGPPGTGKTYKTKEIAYCLLKGDDK
ncbi:MAG: hypothetical protein ACOC5D_02955 [Thermoplasmatota archaeon]